MTAVEYLINELSDIIGPIEATISGELLLAGAIKRAKEMEKEQILAAHSDWSRITENLPTRSAVQYFKETFKSE